MNLNSLAQTFLPEKVYQLLISSDITRRITRGSFWSLVNALIQKTFTLTQAILLARILGISGFGEWGILLSTLAMVKVFASFGLGVTTTKHVAEWYKTNPQRLGRLLGLLQLTAICTGFVISLVLFFGAQSIAENLLNAPQLSHALIVVGVIVLLKAIVSIYFGILIGLEKFRVKAIIDSISTFKGVIIVILLAYYYGLMGAVIGLAFMSFFKMVILVVWVYVILKRMDVPLYKTEPFNEWKGLRDFALPTACSGALVMLAMWAIQIALFRQPGGTEEMGAYQAANQWRTVVIFLPTQLLAAYLPILSSLLGSDREKLIKMQHKTLMGVTITTLAISLPIMLISPWLMSLYGSEFSAYWLILAIVVSIPVFDIAHVLFQKTAIAQGYAWTLLLSNIPLIISAGIGVFWLIPKYLGLGLALCLLLCYVSRSVAEYVIFRLKAHS